jgi:predicted porin
MKKSLIVLAALGAFATVASAQSSVTLYGRVDLSVGKNAGNSAKVMQNGSGSRFGVRGVEDLGGGMSAFFNIEHRFDADTGAASSATRFWTGRSLVGLQGGFGKISLGREYTTAFLGSQLANDPWGWDTIAASTGTAGITGLGIAAVRNDSSLTYNFSASGFSFGAQIAEATDTFAALQAKPFNFSLGYAAGPVSLNFGYEKTGAEAAATAKVMTFGGMFDMGAVKLGASYGKGTTAADDSHKGWMITAVAPMGQGQFRAAVGRRSAENAGGVTIAAREISLFAVGYHYSLSKRTTLYADFARNSKLTADKTAYDFGIKHNF